jgi:hypothetical protein
MTVSVILNTRIDELNKTLEELYNSIGELYDSYFGEFTKLIRSFTDDLKKNSLNVDEYYEHVLNLVKEFKLDIEYLIKRRGSSAIDNFREFLIEQIPKLKRGMFIDNVEELKEILKNTDDPLILILIIAKLYDEHARRLFRIACGQKNEDLRDAVLLLAESLRSISIFKPVNSMIAYLASLAIAYGRRDIADKLMSKVGEETQWLIKFTCAVAGTVTYLENEGVEPRHEDIAITRYGEI